ncbi:glycine oxidase ThiO [Pelagibius marinus]|uniref:glycine oxidase ThiO n=1 Tax=Pelagibius marinus TaxID=2762760 RepID=UPI001D0486D0|nr:glycine oxidase ThiO [Pelagibius marinus]
MRVTVIGAGVAGLTCATELLKRGAEVTVVDRAPELGAGSCSWWAGGMLAPWCEGESAEEPVVRLGSAAADWWDAHAGGVTRQGTLVVAPGRDSGELRRFARRTMNFSQVDAEAIALLEPDLVGRFRRGLFFAGEAHLDPRAAIKALAKRLRDGGAELRFSTAAENFPQADVVVDCRGLAARDVAPGLRGVRGEMLVLRCRELALTRTLRLLHPRIPVYIVPRGEGVYMLGATMIESASRSPVSARSLVELLNAAYALHPAFGEAEVVEIGVDARPAFPDNLPRVWRDGRSVFVNGLYRHGFLLAPALARRAADLVFGETPIPEESDADRLERQTL